MIETPGGRVAIETTAGDGRGPWFVLTPGLGNDRTLYCDVLRCLDAAGARAVAIDLLGFGESDRLDDGAAYSLDGEARAVGAVCRALGIDEPHFVLHSMTSGLLTSPAMPKPGAVTLLEGNLLPEDAGWAREIVALDGGDELARYIDRMARHGSRIIAMALAATLDEARLRQVGGCYGRMAMRAFGEIAADNLRLTDSGAILEALVRLVEQAVPVRYLRGGASPAWSGRETLDAIGVDYMELPDSGHYAMLDAPVALSHILRDVRCRGDVR